MESLLWSMFWVLYFVYAPHQKGFPGLWGTPFRSRDGGIPLTMSLLHYIQEFVILVDYTRQQPPVERLSCPVPV